ncbi:MAG: sensor histidine kinase [Actinomycetota bacterium]|nr:sensor histidine kinase [Actinomycetota bacterium]
MSALFWRLFLVNALVFVTATAVLVLSPVTVSSPISTTEVVVLVGGLALMLAVNALLLRASLSPLDGLTALMERVDLLRPGERLAVAGYRDLAHLIRTFNQMLDRLEAERGTSTAQALAAQEGERRRIARELHDEIGQSLTAVLLSLKQTVDRAPRGLKHELRDVQEMVRSSLEEVRNVARRLRPGVLDDLGLASALSALLSDLRASSGVSVVGRVDPGLPQLTSEAELVLYRVAQESLTNVARHADASEVSLSLTTEQHRVVLRVVDDGRGIDGGTEGAGIRGMRERAILVGADLAISQGHRRGTDVRLSVPMTAGSE